MRAGQAAWSPGLCSDHTHSPQVEGFSVHGALGQEDPDAVEPTVHDREMQSCRVNLLLGKPRIRAGNMASSQPPLEQDAATAAPVHSHSHGSPASPPPRMESCAQPRQTMHSVSVVTQSEDFRASPETTAGLGRKLPRTVHGSPAQSPPCHSSAAVETSLPKEGRPGCGTPRFPDEGPDKGQRRTGNTGRHVCRQGRGWGGSLDTSDMRVSPVRHCRTSRGLQGQIL